MNKGTQMQNFIKQCQEAYFAGYAIISDAEYDTLIKRFPTSETSIGPKGDVPHLYRMYSLQKVYPGRGDKPPFNPLGQAETVKLDGCAISLLYIGGKLIQALTRGNGILGNDVTANIKNLNVPKTIKQTIPTQIIGEVIITKKVDNMRNYSSGAVNLKDEAEFVERIGEAGLVFVAYGIQCSNETVGISGSYLQDMLWLEDQQFLTVVNVHTYFNWVPTDGKVIRVNDNNAFFREGWTNKFPRAAYAVKEDEEGEVTILRRVEWQVGASGKVTPVGHFDPITIDDAVITKATLNNVNYIEALDLEIDCYIRVIRAGGVIPKVIERIYDLDQ